ncbi:MAG: FAD-binding oxidoreductase [Methylobacterium mesophilicum]|nr:FAD-binding oxidoreductase [Methylobacterium mesophilicum]
MTARYPSFGRATPPALRATLLEEAELAFREHRAASGSLLAYGNGRSYGDSCQSAEGTVIDMREHGALLSFDSETGLVEADAGILLSELIAHATPRGWFPPVVPGTQFVTLGGAIANDIHGKNHHRRGTFGAHVEELALLRSDGETRRCSRTENAELFGATIGGMGLTGIILSARLRLIRVPAPDIAETATPFSHLDDYLDRAEDADAANEYAVAWVDQLATGRARGRGLLLTGNHAERVAGGRLPRQLAVPFQPPLTLLNRPALRAFNFAYRTGRGRSGQRTVPYRSFFFPLDAVRDWNRLYGPRGLFQHQSVIPFEAARQALPELLDATHKAGQGSFLTVLKRFGAQRSPGLLSFPLPGYTLTLDFPNRGEPTRRLLDRLDRIAVAAGGAVNPYKDARMSADTFAASFPDWRALEALRDPAFMSSFWRRTAMRLAGKAPIG